jgi:hypothetical protein
MVVVMGRTVAVTWCIGFCTLLHTSLVEVPSAVHLTAAALRLWWQPAT